MRRHHAWISNQPGVSHPHLKGASGNVAPVELDVNGMHAVLPGDEADRVLVWKQHTFLISGRSMTAPRCGVDSV